MQETLFTTLAARARETRKKKPVLRDPKAAEMVASIGERAAKYERGMGAWINVLRTVIFDSWVCAFLAEHPDGTVVEIGTGLNTRFERVDNGRVHWIDMDVPDTKKKIGAGLTWVCEDPRALEPLGLRVLETTAITRPPRAVRDQLPARYHWYLPLANPLLGSFARLTLFRANQGPHYDSL